MMAQGTAPTRRPVRQPGVHVPEIKELLDSRARYRTIVVVSVIFILLACLVVVSNASVRSTEEQSIPRAVVLVVPHLSSDMLEAALVSNKAPFIALLSAADGMYARPRAQNTELAASLVTILTGNVTSTATDLVGATSFLRTMRKAGKKAIVLAPSLYWSAQQQEEKAKKEATRANGRCSRVGLLDSECCGVACAAEDETAYCNAVEKLLSCDGKAELYEEEVLEGFRSLQKHEADLLYAHVNVLSGGGGTTEKERLAALSDISIMDGTLGKIALAAIERSRASKESWLIMLVGAGGDGLTRTPLAMAAYARGGLVRLGPIPEEEMTLADIAPTVLHWFGLSPAGDARRVRGLCSTGIAVNSCENTTSWP